MMAQIVKKLPAYTATRDALVAALSVAELAFTDAEFSYDPQSEYRQAKAAIDTILLQLRALAVNSLRELDDAIAQSDLIAGLTKNAQKAKKEAEGLSNAVHTISDIAEVVGKITTVVTGITGLL